MSRTELVRAGVIGVGAMGQHHARVYRELPGTVLGGVYDADGERAATVADTYDTEVRSLADLLDGVDVVSVAVPTQAHYETVRECIDAGVDVLVEKPFVENPENGRRLVEFAAERDVTLQVGHIERFNPATRKLMEIAAGLDVIAVDARRVGPPPDRDIDDSAVMDLMIHDVDLVTALVDEPVERVDAMGTENVDYAVAQVQFASGIVGKLAASRVTQEKERKLSLTARNCHLTVDFTEQTIEIHRQSLPKTLRENGDGTYHQENVVERVSVETGEPLKNELSAFIRASVDGTEPLVSGEDGIHAVELTRQIDALADGRRTASPALTNQRSEETVPYVGGV